ncbi:hypothetical protein KIN20_020491 [Parelaphostrongylus tenuis]|uniref:Uncharacterized protein n=1 Tax=Parelaphostrongylus tenuis TaxID=148309 RepID=A0AAD5MMJ0_PARTN|nr:hypothetical protein KIN20_020491 [Parelaphostrongylus tenuis]
MDHLGLTAHRHGYDRFVDIIDPNQTQDIHYEEVCFIFGGLANVSTDPKQNITVYLDDFFSLDIRVPVGSQQWEEQVVRHTNQS